jgi:hypothetical protein
MTESVFRMMLEQKLITAVHLEEAVPSKGKPAKRQEPFTSIWIVRIVLGNGQDGILESARGGAREWASLDKLNRWLRGLGIEKYDVYSLRQRSAALQQSLDFGNGEKPGSLLAGRG